MAKEEQKISPPRNARTVETVTVLPVNHCQQCGEDLQDVVASDH